MFYRYTDATICLVLVVCREIFTTFVVTYTKDLETEPETKILTLQKIIIYTVVCAEQDRMILVFPENFIVVFFGTIFFSNEISSRHKSRNLDPATHFRRFSLYERKFSCSGVHLDIKGYDQLGIPSIVRNSYLGIDLHV